MPHPPQIPLTPQTDERNFPRWEGENAPPGRPGHRYPKMLTRPCTRADREAWVEKNRRTDRVTREDYWEEPPPRVGAPIPMLATQAMVDEGLAQLANEPIVVNDKEDEIRVRAFLGILEPQAPVAKAVSIPLAAPPDEELPPVKRRRRRRRRIITKPRPQQHEVVEELD